MLIFTLYWVLSNSWKVTISPNILLGSRKISGLNQSSMFTIIFRNLRNREPCKGLPPPPTPNHFFCWTVSNTEVLLSIMSMIKNTVCLYVLSSYHLSTYHFLHGNGSLIVLVENVVLYLISLGFQ